MIGCLLFYCPVAATMQTIENVTVLLAGSIGKLISAPCSIAIVMVSAVGQDEPPDTPVQLACVRLKPQTIQTFDSLSTC